MRSPTAKLFNIGLRQVFRDGMLLLILPAPFIYGLVLRGILTTANAFVIAKGGESLVPWYGLSDGLLLTLTPLTVAMISAFVMLDERDEGIGAYFSITPAAGSPYLWARLVWPMLWAFACTLIVQTLFGLTNVSIIVVLAATTLGLLQAVAVAMLLVALAGNKVEGLALSKLSGLSMLGLPAAWVLSGPLRAGFAVLPSFWLGELMLQGQFDLRSFMFGVLTGLAWINLLTRLFLRRAKL